MRVYELSKELGISNKELLELLKEHGFTLTTVAKVSDAAIELAKKTVASRASTGTVSPEKTPVKTASNSTLSTEKAKDKAKEDSESNQSQNIRKETTDKSQPPTAVKAQETPVAERQQKESTIIKNQHSEAQAKGTAQAQAGNHAASQSQKPTAQVASPKNVSTHPAIDERRAQKPESPKVEKEIEITIEPMAVSEFAQAARKQASEVILTLLKQGTVATINQRLSEKTVRSLAQTYGLKTAEKKTAQPKAEEKKPEVSAEGEWQEKIPVVVVVGHVDHGKTTLLDFIRKTRVAAKEKGGITQHVGSYEVKTKHGNIVFLDTPGHEAFTLLRARGIKVADIAILVVAADDGIMPQTLDAIKRAKAANIPLIVALNKIDKASVTQIETVKRQLAQHDLTPEEWGGNTIVMPISAKLGQGIDELLDVLVLQSQMMELKANLSVPARGYILESKLEKGRGPVATVITQHGILKVGDYFQAGTTWGKVNALVDSYGKQVKTIGPALPVQVSGFSELPQAGDAFEVTTAEKARKASEMGAQAGQTTYKKGMGEDQTKENEVNIILKADNASSREAIVQYLTHFEVEGRKVAIVSASVGDISESDVIHADDTRSIIYGLHVKVQPNAHSLVQQKGVTIKLFDIIYKLFEEIEQMLIAGKAVKMVSKKIGEASVLKVFDIKNLGIVAGAHVKSGRFVRDGKVIIWRGKQKIGEGPIKSLQRDRKAVKEVHAGFEFALLVDGFEDWNVDDRVECFQESAAS